MRINIHAGHNPDEKIACGAVGLIKESTEARKVKDLVISKLRAMGHTVYDCTVEDGISQSNVLSKIIAKCNQHSVDVDVSIHFNSGRNDNAGDGSIGGTEVFIYKQDSKAKAYAENVCNAIAALGFRSRGVKTSTSLYFLSHAKAPSMLIECCFVDDKDDVSLYNAEKIADAIVLGITSQAVSETKTEVSYMTHRITDNQWGSEVKGRNLVDSKGYSGKLGAPIDKITVKLSEGQIEYIAHWDGKWGSRVSGFSIVDSKQSAGGTGHPIDAITMRAIGIKGKLYYRCHFLNGGWGSDITGFNSNDHTQYAGCFGKPIDAVQIWIE